MINLERLEETLKDPCIQEWQTAMSRGNVLSRPEEFLGEKRAWGVDVAASPKLVREISQFDKKFEQPVPAVMRTNLAESILDSQCVYLSDEMFYVWRDLEIKIRESIYGVDVKTIEFRTLPHDAIWFSSPKGFIKNIALTKEDIGKVTLTEDKIRRIAFDAYLILKKPYRNETCFGFAWDKKGIYICALRDNEAFQEAVCLLLEEKIAKMSYRRPARQFRKQSKRLGFKADEGVNVVYLREYEYHGGEGRGEEKSSFEYACQWIVRGHVRNQYFPGSNSHKLIWIDPYRKGPEDAPFKESVKAIVR